MVSAQQYFENNFSINREEIIINKKDNKLEGHLDLKEFKKLKKLASIDLSNCLELEELSLFNNKKITNINLKNNLKLKRISFYNCPIEQDLTETFSHLTNLESLSIDDTLFSGSLQAFSKSKLERLDIRNCPNIKNGWEFLPTSLNDVLNNNPSLFNGLKDYQNNFPEWKKDHQFLIDRIEKLEKKLTKAKTAITQINNEKEKIEKELESERKVFLNTAENLNNYVRQLEKSEVEKEVQSKFSFIWWTDRGWRLAENKQKTLQEIGN